jgi:hypothetical protein
MSKKEKSLSKKEKKSELRRLNIQKQIEAVRGMQIKPVSLAVKSAIPLMCSKF